jgi:hypothetical protein
MAMAMLCPIYKRGDLAVPKNYRPVVVSTVLHKLYALCLGYHVNWHISQQGEDFLPRQAGFLPQRSTLHNMFVLQHLAHHYWRMQKVVYVALLDVSAAYDTTNHAKMVETLIQQQFPLHLVRGIASMYTSLQYKVAVNGSLHTEAFRVGIGVKQGCPLSPVLYNLYVQPLSGTLAAMGLGPRFPGVVDPQPDYHYADDIALADEAKEGLQALLGGTAGFMHARDLDLGVPKCVGLVLGDNPIKQPHVLPLKLGEEEIPQAPPNGSTRYLGLMFDSLAGPTAMANHRANCFASSYFAATAAMTVAPGFPCAISTFLKLLRTVMEPAGLYGCELWGLLSMKGIFGTRWSLATFYQLEDPLEQQRCSLIKKWLRLPQSTPRLCMLHELGCEPLVHEYLRRAVRFYNTLAALPDSCVYKAALKQNVEDAFTVYQGAKRRVAPNFMAALYKALGLILPRTGGLLQKLRNCELLDPAEVDIALRTRYQEHITELSRVHRGDGAKAGVYFREVAKHALGEVPRYYSLHLSHGVLVRFLRFRLGCHHLRVNTGRWEIRNRQNLAREQRTCLRCQDTAMVDDEAHCLFKCGYPTLEEMRETLMEDCSEAVPGAQLVTHAHFWDMLEQVASVQLCRRAVCFVAACVRVAWQCYKAGGCDIEVQQRPIMSALPPHLDPDIWALHYFDNFDSTSGSDNEDMAQE